MPAFDAILFDFDGVLMDSEPVHYACWREALLPVGVMLEWEFYRDRCIGIDDRLMLKLVAPERDGDELWTRYPAKQELFRARMLADPPFPENLAPLLRELAAGYKLAVVSSSSCAEIEPLLVRARLREYFATIVGGEDVERHKPAPDPYLLAAGRLEARSPLVLEDSAPGLASARAAGFAVLEVRNPGEVGPRLRQMLGNAAAAL